MRYFLLCFLLAFYTSAAQASDISENERMRGYVDKIEKLYAEVQLKGDMPAVAESYVLSALATGYAFLNDETQMHEYLSRFRQVDQRWLLIRPYVQLIASKLAMNDLVGAQQILEDIDAVVAVINKPAPLFSPVPEESPLLDMQVFHERLYAQMLNERSARLPDAAYVMQYACPLLAEHVAQKNDVALLGRVLKACHARKYQAALLIRQGKIAQAYDRLKMITVPPEGSGGEMPQIAHRPLDYRYDHTRLFANCRKEKIEDTEIAELISRKDARPETILAILVELGALDAAYDYVLSRPIAGDTVGKWGGALDALFTGLVEKQADDKAIVLARRTGLLQERRGRCWARCGAHGSPWWLSPINITDALAKRSDFFAFRTVQEIKDPRARFLSLMTIYHAVPADSTGQFPSCEGNTQACALQAMAEMAHAYDDGGSHADGFSVFDDVPAPKELMYAVTSEFARVTGDQVLADKMAAEIKEPDAHVVPESTDYTGSARTVVQLAAEISEKYIWRYRGREAAEKIYPPIQDFPRRYANAMPQEDTDALHLYPALSVAVKDMQEDMDRHSWRYYSATLSRNISLSGYQQDRFEGRCLLDRGVTPIKGWPKEADE